MDEIRKGALAPRAERKQVRRRIKPKKRMKDGPGRAQRRIEGCSGAVPIISSTYSSKGLGL